MGVYDAERRKAAAEAVIAENEVSKIQAELEELEALRALGVRQMEFERDLREPLCAARTELDGFGVPWRFTSWTSDLLELTIAELDNRGGVLELLSEAIVQFEISSEEAAVFHKILKESLSDLNAEADRLASLLSTGKEDFRTQVEAFERVYRALSAYRCGFLSD